MSKIKTVPNDQRPANQYDDGNIPQVDLPMKDSSEAVPLEAPAKDVIPDEVPRRDGPGGEE